MAVLTLSVTVPDEKLGDVIDALAYQNGYTDEIEDDDGNLIPNPVTKAQYIKAWILHVVRASYKAYNDKLAVGTALDNQDEDGSDFS